MKVRYMKLNDMDLRHLTFLAVLALAGHTQASQVATLTEVHGITTVHTPGSAARFVRQGEAIRQGEIISTSAHGFVTLTAADDSRITLRPSTSFAFEEFNTEAGREAAIMRVSRGGISAVSGALSQRRPGAVKVVSPTATIGVHGADFDVRVCGDDDCASEARNAGPSPAVPAVNPVAARVAFLRGKASARGPQGVRELMSGAPVFPGESIVTDDQSHAVLAFSDRARVTVQASSEFLIDSYSFTEGAAEQGKTVLRLLQGAVRIQSGQIGKHNPDHFGIETPVGSIRVRGTGVDLSCTGRCVPTGPAGGDLSGAFPNPALRQASVNSPPSPTGGNSPPTQDSGLFTYVWQGGVVVTPLSAGGSTPPPSTLINESQTGFFAPGQPTLSILPQPPSFFTQSAAPRPDTVSVNHDTMFGTQSGSGNAPGTYAFVRNGHMSVQGALGPTIDLGSNETALVQPGSSQGAVRLNNTPAFIANDPTPRPTRPLPPPPPPSSPKTAASTTTTPSAGDGSGGAGGASGGAGGAGGASGGTGGASGGAGFAGGGSTGPSPTNPLLSPFNPGSSAGCEVSAQ